MECNLVWNHTRDFKIERARSVSSIWNHKYDFRPKLHDPKFNYHFIKSILKSSKYRTWPIQIFYWCRTEAVFKSKAEPETLLLQYVIEQRACFCVFASNLRMFTRPLSVFQCKFSPFFRNLIGFLFLGNCNFYD